MCFRMFAGLGIPAGHGLSPASLQALRMPAFGVGAVEPLMLVWGIMAFRVQRSWCEVQGGFKATGSGLWVCG